MPTTSLTIDNPAALGWVQDPDTGRWVWQSSSGGGGDGGTSGPISTSMVATESADLLPWLADPSELRTQKDVNRYLNEKIDNFQETDPTVPDHVKAITNSQIASWDAGTGAGGGAGPDPRISDSDIVNWDAAFGWGDHGAEGYATEAWVTGKGYLESFTETDPVFSASVAAGITQTDINNWNAGTGGGGGGGFSGSWNDLTDKPTIPTNNNQLTNGAGYVTSSVVSGYATEAWVRSNYQPAGSYLTASSLNGYATTSYAYSKSESDNKYELKGQGGSGATPDLQAVTSAGATTSKSITAPNFHCGTDGYTLGGTSSGGARLIISSGLTYSNTSNSGVFSVTNTGQATATDFTASSDRNLKDHIETAPTGVVDKLRGVTFQWKEDGRESSGVIAQEVQDAGLGHLVEENERGLAVNYNGLVAYLIEEIKDLKAQVEELKRD